MVARISFSLRQWRETVLATGATFTQRAQRFFILTKYTKAGFFLQSLERQWRLF
jgi:hypothetical protein